MSAVRVANSDDLVVEGGRPLRGTLRMPGDKSISHRALLFASVASGASTVRNLADGDDVAHTLAALCALGVRAQVSPGGAVVQGCGFDGLQEPESVIDCGNSGTTMRVLSGLVAGREFLTVLTGDTSLRGRPMDRVVRPLRKLGATVDGRGGGLLAPLVIRGGGLTGAHISLEVASAQAKTSLVLAGLQARGMTEIVEPAPSRDHTERMLAALGAPVDRIEGGVRVRSGSPETFELDVPGDPSSAAFFVVGATVVPGSEVLLEGLAINPTRLGFLEVLRRMGADIELRERGERLGEPVGDLRVRSSPLQGTIIAGEEIPRVMDEVPALGVAAAFADGVSEIRDAAELRGKESDRIATLAQELAQMGAGVEERGDGLMIRGGMPHSGTFKSHGDHRIAMAGAIAASACTGASTVRGWGAVASSYPGFADDLGTLVAGR